MPGFENPFTKPSPRKADASELIGALLGEKEKQRFKEMMGEDSTEDREEKVVPDVTLTDEEQGMLIGKEAWQRERIKQETKKLSDFFGKDILVPEFPKEITSERLEQWERQGFELHYLPAMEMGKDMDYPGWEKKPNDWFYAELQAGKLSSDAATLKPGWILIDARDKPVYEGGKQMYENDPFKQTIAQLRQQGQIAEGPEGQDPGSRFSISWEEWNKAEVKQALAQVLKIQPEQLSLPRAIEFDVLGNLHYPSWGITNTWEWFCDKRDRNCLYGGCGGIGGFSLIARDSVSSRAGYLAARLLVRFST